jgi:hypothetical protein
MKQQVKVGADGFCYQGRRYNHRNLAGYVGQRLSVFGFGGDTVNVLNGTRFVCVAIVQPVARRE